MIARISEEIAQAAEEKRIIISPIPIGAPVYVIDTCKCSPLYAPKCKRAENQFGAKPKAVYSEPLGSDGRAFRCARVFVRPFDYSKHFKKIGKSVFESRTDMMLMVAHMIKINQH